MTYFDSRTAFLITGMLYILMPLVVWVALRREQNSVVKLWCSGGELFGLSLLLISLRGTVPDWMGFELSSLFMHLGNVQRIQALRTQLGKPLSKPTFVALTLTFWLVYVACLWTIPHGPYHFTWTMLAVSFQSLWVYRLAQQISEKESIESAKWLGYAYLPLAIFLTLRAIQVVTGQASPGPLINEYTTLLIALMGIVAAVLGNTSFLAVFVERASRQRIQMTVDSSAKLSQCSR